MAERQHLTAFVDMGNPDEVYKEVETIIQMVSKDFNFERLADAYDDISNLFAGKYPGYKACNTEYHDFAHTTDTFLAMARLIHGATVQGKKFTDLEILLSLIATLLHDSGYIQSIYDHKGTGAKYTAIHVERSAEFLIKYFHDKGYSKQEGEVAANIIRCTGLNVEIPTLSFSNENVKLLGKMLGTADLLGQMADRHYLEKLLFLFYEFEEGKIPGYNDEFDLLLKTIDFYKIVKKRLAKELDSTDKFMKPHFKIRWNDNTDYYKLAIERHMKYLKHLAKHPEDYQEFLRRGGLVEKLKKRQAG